MIDLLRHGDVEGKKCFRGHTDEPLSPNGWQQMSTTIENYQADLVVCSPLRRCAEFATEWSDQQNIKLIKMHEFKEINFGDWDGLSPEEIRLSAESELNVFWKNPAENTPPNGEKLLDFQKRVLSGWQNLIEKYKEQNILLISHGGVIRIIIAHVLSIPVEKLLSIESPLASLSGIRISFDQNNQHYASLAYHAKGPEVNKE